MIISVKNTPIDSTWPAFIDVARTPEAWPRSPAGTPFMIMVALGELKRPDPMPLRNSNVANTG